MNLPTKRILLTAGFGLGLSLTSCVAPYEGETRTSVTTYRPGYTVNTLPGGYRTEVIDGTDYYYTNGNYYRRRGSNYVVVDAPRRSRYYEEYTRFGNRTYRNQSGWQLAPRDRIAQGLHHRDPPR